MTCIAPPELNEGQLIAAVEGEPPAQVRDHLERCPTCRARAEDLARLYAGLHARLHRLDCPPADALGEFQLGLLTADQRAMIDAHLSHCPRCRGERAQLDGYLDSLAGDLELNIAERVKVLIARLVRGGGDGPILGLAPAGVRGGDGGTLLYEAGPLQIALEILPAPGSPGRSELLGLISGGDSEGLTTLLHADGRQVAAADVDPAGNFVLSDLAPGTYTLTLRGPGLEVQVPELRVT